MRKIIAIMLLAFSSYASAAWLFNGIWYSNVCVSPVGTWIYPVEWAQPVGTFCRLPNGTPGVVQ